MSDQSYIETIPKRGYRFVGEVKEATEHTGDVAEGYYRQALAVAARKGLPLGDFVAEAIQSKLSAASDTPSKPWMKHFGSLRHLHSESERIGKIIDDEFESIDEKEWR